MRIAIVGAGAIGCSVAARLAQAKHDVVLVVRDEARRRAVEQEGLVCTEANALVCATPRAVARLPAEPVDVLFLAVKSGDITALVASLPATVVGADTLVVPLVNGIPWWIRLGSADAVRPIKAIDPQGALLERFAPEQLMGSVVYTTAMMTGAATVSVKRTQSLILGAIVGETPASLVELVGALKMSGIATTLSDRIRDDVWTKAALNLATNPLSVVTEASLGDLCSDPRLLPTVSAILDETWRVAARHDARPLLTRSEMIKRGRAAGGFRTSMLEDYRKGRPIELDAIAYAVFELAEAIGLDMPVARSIADLARFRAARPFQETIA